MEGDALNQWRYISDLIPEYNSLVAATRPECRLFSGDNILQLRNALAHGMAAGIGRAGDPEPDSPRPVRLIKFGRPSSTTGRVRVEFAEDMTPEWLRRQQDLIQEAIQTVFRYIAAEGIGAAPRADQ